MVTKTEKIQDNEDGAIIYSDGGSRGNWAGAGYHGFTYSLNKPSKGSGCTTQYITINGYVPKVEVKDKNNIEEVKPINYINGFISFNTPLTNNVAELMAAQGALRFAANKTFKNLSVITDSEMVVKGATQWIDTWKKNGWIKTDGLPVANKECWLGLDKEINALKQNGCNVNFKWVKGHSTHLGNQLADKLATIGVLHSKEGKIRSELDVEVADGYWKDSNDKSPMITHKRIYFTTDKDSIVPGEYYLGDHGKDDDLLGKRTADGCFSYIKLNTPEPAIEMFRQKQSDIASGLDVIIMGRLDKLFSSDVYNDIMRYGATCLYTPNKEKMDLHYVDNEPVSKELRPPRIAMRAVDELSKLKGILLAYQDGNDANICSTYITDILYEKDDKNVFKLKPEYVVGFTDLKISVNYNSNGIISQKDVSVCMGVDLPERNYLKRLEKINPEIIVITWMESDKIIRYATVVKSDEGIGIWAGVYSNSRLITD